MINASGHGANSIFHSETSIQVRGDLVILRVPIERLTDHMRKISQYGFWAGGSHYVFLRYSLDGKWMEVVLGGTFIKKAHDLLIRPETIRRIVSFWPDFFHKAPASENDIAQKETLISSVVSKASP